MKLILVPHKLFSFSKPYYDIRLSSSYRTFLYTHTLNHPSHTMNSNLAEIICIIDRSGSMEAIRTDAIGGFNSFLDRQKKEPGEAKLTLILFDHEYDVVYHHVEIKQVPPLTAVTYVPRGTTALLDAVGRTIDDVGKRLHAMPEHDRPGKVIVAILTDGMENASRDYTLERVSEMIRHQREKYAWEFLFLAANQDAITTAASMSIPALNAVTFVASSAGTAKAFDNLDSMVAERRKRT